MKKLVFAAALACMGLAFSSCGDVQKCYEIKVTYTLAGLEMSTTIHERCTKNELKDVEDRVKETLPALSENITIKSQAVPDSNCE